VLPEMGSFPSYPSQRKFVVRRESKLRYESMIMYLFSFQLNKLKEEMKGGNYAAKLSSETYLVTKT
jgi:hypothetical protein